MKFSFIDLDGKTIKGECERLTNTPLNAGGVLEEAIKNSTALEAVLGEFDFYQIISSESTAPVLRFAVDNENNVFHSDKLPDFVQIGSDWKELN